MQSDLYLTKILLRIFNEFYTKTTEYVFGNVCDSTKLQIKTCNNNTICRNCIKIRVMASGSFCTHDFLENINKV